jgi:hypothetical protein
MTTDRELDEILAEIGREHRAIGAPDRLESVLCAAPAGRKATIGMPRLRSAWTLAAVGILLAAVATAGVFWQTRRNHQTQGQQAQNQQALSGRAPTFTAEPTHPSTRVAGHPNVQSKSAALRSAEADRAGHRNPPAKQPSSNSLDEFVPLPVSEGLPPAAELSVVRIKLRGSDLQQYGLEAPADAEARTMLAEFVVGEDGLPRAIRILR